MYTYFLYKIKIYYNTNNGDYMNIDYLEAFKIIPRSITSLVVLFFITKLMGKKQVSELSLFDYVIGISIGNFTAEMVMSFDNQYINGIVAIITFGVISYLVSVVTMKNMTLRRFIIGVPTVIIEDGKISLEALKKTKLDINDLLEQCRTMGYFDIKEISYAILEVNGKISILPKSDYQVPTLTDLNIKKDKNYLSSNIIIDGKLIKDNLENTNKDEKWLKKELKKQGYSSYNNILLATLTNGNLAVFEKNHKRTKKVLE